MRKTAVQSKRKKQDWTALGLGFSSQWRVLNGFTFLKKDCLDAVWRLESKERKTDFSQDTQTVGPGEMTDCDRGNGGRKKWPDWE